MLLISYRPIRRPGNWYYAKIKKMDFFNYIYCRKDYMLKIPTKHLLLVNGLLSAGIRFIIRWCKVGRYISKKSYLYGKNQTASFDNLKLF